MARRLKRNNFTRLIGHAIFVGIAALAIVIVRLPWNQIASPLPVSAGFDAAPAPGPYTGDHAEHFTPLEVIDAGLLTRLADSHTERPNAIRPSVITYTIAAGDTPFSIAGQFGLKPETILWGNPLLSENAEALSIGAAINILPVDGVLHYAAEGDTVERLQLLYGIPVEDIVSYLGNEFPDEPPYTLTPGQKVIVPGGRKPIIWKEPGPPVIAGRGRKSPGFYQGSLVKTGLGYFIWPVPPDVITQYYWAGHPAIDVDTYAGQPILAADSGTVIFSGWDSTGFGYLNETN